MLLFSFRLFKKSQLQIFMPTANEQQRRVTGIYHPNYHKRVKRGEVGLALGLSYNTPTFDTNLCISVTSIVVFIYMLCMLLSMCVDIGKSAGPGDSVSYGFIRMLVTEIKMTHFWDLRILINCGFLILLKFMIKLKDRPLNKGIPNRFSLWSCVLNLVLILAGNCIILRQCSLNDILMFCCNVGITCPMIALKFGGRMKLINKDSCSSISMWSTIVNLILIVVSNTSLLNPGPTKKFSILYQNVRGFIPFRHLGESHPPLDVTKVMEFQSYVVDKKPDLVVLNETWLSKSHLDNEILPSEAYKIFRLDRSEKSHPVDPVNPNKFKRNGGGVLIAVRVDAEVESRIVKSTCKAEILSVRLDFGSKNVLCVSTCYRVGTLGSSNCSEIQKHLNTISKTKKLQKHCLVGDFNLRHTSWPEGESSNDVEKGFLDIFDDLSLTQLVEGPTHEKGNTLDLVLSNVPSLVSGLKILDQNAVCSSDHYGIAFNLGSVTRKRGPKREVPNWSRADWDALNNELKHIPWDSHLMHCDADTSWSRFKDILLNCCKKHIPNVKVQYKFQPPWFDSETHNLCRKKERLRAKFKVSNSPEDYAKFSQCRKDFKNLVQEKMSSNFEEEANPDLISKKFWTHLKASSNSSRIPETVSYNGKFRNNPVDQSELFNAYFADQFSEPSLYNISINYHPEPNGGLQITHQNIRKLLKNINVNKSPGPDGIHGKVLKNCAVSISYPLSLIFKTSYNTGQIPKEWKLANVVPVHKKGSKGSVENYRPISLTCLVMKIFEKIVRDEIMLRCHHLLNNKQHGFLPQRSCTTQLIPFCDSLAVSLNNACRIDVVYFDFAKAFDSVSHDIILDKLKNQYGIDGTLLKFIVNYLQDREQCVAIGGCKSEYRTVTSGVPQGSILGPLFFVLFINDMMECMSEGTSIALYADDTKIWRVIHSWSDHIILQNDIGSLYDWSVRNKMNFHPDKCKVLRVSLEHDIHNHDSDLPFNTFHYCLDAMHEMKSLLSFVDSEKDLGLIMTYNLSSALQSSAMYSKISSRLGLLKRVCHFIKSEKQKVTLYYAMCRSILEHACTAWGPSLTQIEKLEKVQKRAVKWILGEEYHSYNSHEYNRRLFGLKILPLQEKFMFTDLLLFHKIFHGLICIEFPSYISRVSEEDINRLRNSRLDQGCVKCTIHPRVDAFKSSFFHRNISHWNNLPLEIKMTSDSLDFENKLKAFIWDRISLLNSDVSDNDDETDEDND